MKWKGWYSVFTGIPNFSLFISTAWLNSPLNKATRDTCDLHNHTFPEQPSRQNLDQILEIRKSCLSGHGNWRDNVRWSVRWAFHHRMCQGSKGRGAFDDCLGEVSSWTGNSSGMEECKGKKNDFLDELLVQQGLQKEQTTLGLHFWRCDVSDVSERDRVLYFCSSIAD